jgi:hypothetical protein
MQLLHETSLFLAHLWQCVWHLWVLHLSPDWNWYQRDKHWVVAVTLQVRLEGIMCCASLARFVLRQLLLVALALRVRQQLSPKLPALDALVCHSCAITSQYLLPPENTFRLH